MKESSDESNDELDRDWQRVEAQLEELRMNPPTVPISDVQISKDQMSVEIGPIRPGTVNWGIYLALVCGVVVPPLIWFPEWWFLGPPAAVLLTFLFRKMLSPLSETLRITADDIVVERSWKIPLLGKKTQLERVWTEEAAPPRVYRLADAVEAYEEGEGPRPGIGYEGLVFESMSDKATFAISVMNQNKIISDAGREDKGELDWLQEITTIYIGYMRRGPDLVR